MLLSYVVDFKLTPDNRLKVLELGEADQSGSEGIDCFLENNKEIKIPRSRYLTQKYQCSPMSAKVYERIRKFGLENEFYNTAFDCAHGFRRYHIYHYVKERPPVLKKQFSDSRYSISPEYKVAVFGIPDLDGRHIKIHYKKRKLKKYAWEKFFPIRWQHKYFQDEILYINSTNFIRPIFYDKGALWDIAKNTQMEKYLPKQVFQDMFENTTSEDIIMNVNNNFDLKKPILFKPLNSARGKGIIWITDKNLKTISEKLLKPSNNTNGYEAYPLNCYSVEDKGFLIQEYIKGKKITKDGQRYDPTGRAFMMAWKDKNNQIQIEFLGAYWKLPEKPLSDERKTSKNYISNINPLDSKAPNSALISDNELGTIKDQLDRFSKIMINTVCQPDNKHIIDHCVNHDISKADLLQKELPSPAFFIREQKSL